MPPRTDRAAELERENAELRRQLAESLDQQAATAEVLQALSRSTLDLQPVLDTIAQTMARLCRAEMAFILRRDGEVYRAAAAVGWSPEYKAFLEEHPIAPDRGTLTGRVILEGRAVHIDDITVDPDYALAETASLGKARTQLGVPLLREGMPIGVIILSRQRVEPFSERQIELVVSFADQAVIAIENTRLITETREALEQQTATAEVLGVINSSPGDLKPVFDAILEKAHSLCGAAFGSLVSYDGEFLRSAAERNLPPAWADFVRGPIPLGGPDHPATRLMRGEPFLHIEDLAELARTATDPMPRAGVELAGIRTLLLVPLRKDGVFLGYITAFRQEVRPFTDKQIALLQNFAAQAVIAMENAGLITETREALERQTAVSEVLGIISSSPGELQPVFDAVLAHAVRICGGAFGLFGLWENGGFRGVATSGVGAVFADALSRIRHPPPGTSLNLAQVTKQIVHQPDCAADPAYDPVRAANPDFAKVRANLTVPMLREGEFLGALAIYRDEARPFDPKQVELVENFAAQAVIAMENARLITETREALEQQTATAEVLQVINSSPGDLKPVFDAMLEKAMSLCEAAFGMLWTYDGNQYDAAALHGTPPSFTEFLTRGPIIPGPETGLGRLTRDRQVIHIPDIAADKAYERADPLRVASVELGGGRSFLAVPLLRDEELAGAFVIYRQEVRPFSNKQIALVSNFAAQAVIAMENARLLTETREALDQQTATAEVLGVINTSPGDLAPVFDAMLEKAMRLCGAAFGELQTYDGEVFRLAAMRSIPAAYAEFRQSRTHVYGPGTVPAKFVAGEGIQHISDVKDSAAYRDREPNRKALVDLGGARTVLAVPLRRKDGALLGFINAYRQEVRPYTEAQVALLQNFAAQAVIAMENARLITETREALEQQTATAEVLGVINSSPGDLGPVFTVMLEKATRLCEAAFGVLFSHDLSHAGNFFSVAAMLGAPLRVAELLREPFQASPEIGLARLLQGEDIVINEDMAAEAAYRTGDPVRTVMVDIAGARSALQVPLRKDGLLLGAFVIYRQEVRPFTDKHIALIQNFAAQAVIAMENARLITETREALDQQTATAEVLGVINSSPGELRPVFGAMLEKAMILCGVAFGFLLTYRDGQFQVGAVHGPHEVEAWAAEIGSIPPEPGSAMLRLVQGEDLVQVTDAADHDLYRYGGAARKAIVEVGGYRSLLAVALRKDEALLGALYMYRQEVGPFTDKQIALLRNFAAQAVIAMENARLLGELRQRTDEIAALNRGLEARVAEQVDELGRVGNLKRFLPPQVAEMVVSRGDERILESHRREIVVVFCDVRGYTAFSETAEPEEVIEFLGEYHAVLGPLITRFEGTLSHFLGDGLMVFFNDPVPCPDPAERAVKMAVAMREAAGGLVSAWRRRGHQMGFGAGVAQGYATLGQIGFADRSDYTAIGTVCNLAARLCGEAADGQILLARRVAVAVEGGFVLEELGALTLKGLTQPVAAFNVVGADGLAAAASD